MVQWVGSADVAKQFKESVEDSTGDFALIGSLAD